MKIDKNKKYLVVGGDSLVGSHLYEYLLSEGFSVWRTTRKSGRHGQNWIQFDFTDPISYENADEYDQAFIVAAATNYERCETDPMARRINVDLIPNAIERMMELGVFCSYISTNSVFGGNQKWPDENAKHDAQIPYAQQKSESEYRLRKLATYKLMSDRFNIIRLTKIMHHSTQPIPEWLSCLQSNQAITPFEDLTFSPMSAQYAAKAIATVGLFAKPGNFHLSGAKNISYVDFAREVLKQFGFYEGLLKPTTSIEKGITIAFNPKYSGIGMGATTNTTGVLPQTLTGVVADLKLSFGQTHGL